MRFRIGPWVYRVRITDGPIVREGKRLLGEAVYDTREVLISPDVDPQHRYEVLLHELRHCWAFYFPKPKGEEEEADFHATIAASTHMDLENQGGIAALVRLAKDSPFDEPPAEPTPALLAAEDPVRYVPAALVEAWETPAKSSGRRAQCAKCSTLFGGGSIVDSKPRWDVVANGSVITRMLYCGHCDHVQGWVEGCSNKGVPNGAVVEGPFFRHGRAAEKLLSEHPELVGLIAV